MWGLTWSDGFECARPRLQLSGRATSGGAPFRAGRVKAYPKSICIEVAKAKVGWQRVVLQALSSVVGLLDDAALWMNYGMGQQGIFAIIG